MKIALLFFTGFALLIALYSLYGFIKERNHHRKTAIYIKDKKTGTIHTRQCVKVNELPRCRKIYLNEWQYRYLRDKNHAQLNYCRLCINLK